MASIIRPKNVHYSRTICLQICHSSPLGVIDKAATQTDKQQQPIQVGLSDTKKKKIDRSYPSKISGNVNKVK